MKLLVQNRASSMYLKSDETWTPDPKEALRFNYSSNAVEFCKSHHMVGVQVIGQYEVTGDEVVMRRF